MIVPGIYIWMSGGLAALCLKYIIAGVELLRASQRMRRKSCYFSALDECHDSLPFVLRRSIFPKSRNQEPGTQLGVLTAPELALSFFVLSSCFHTVIFYYISATMPGGSQLQDPTPTARAFEEAVNWT